MIALNKVSDSYLEGFNKISMPINHVIFSN